MTTTQTTSPGERRLYKSTFKFGNFIFPTGRVAHFKGGMYVTSDAYEIKELDREISLGHPQIYIDPNARTISAEQENPMLALKKKFYEEFMAEQAAHLDPTNNLGESAQGPLKPASTTDIAPVTVGQSTIAARIAAKASGKTAE